MTAPTGAQYTLTLDDQEAVVTELGATLRSYRVQGRNLVSSFEETHSPLGCQGQHMMPWPNRIRDGRWVHDGVQLQLPLSEPERNNAIHGLVCWVPWTTVAVDETSITQRYLLHPQPGWPGVVELQLTHALGSEGLRVEVQATNVGEVGVPFGYGAHPYLVAPGQALGECTLQVPFEQLLSVDARLLPVELLDVEGSVADLRTARLLAGIGLDTAFTRAQRHDGRWQVVLSGAEHRTVLWGDEKLPWLQLYTPGGGRTIAVEPMSCGPDAFNPGPTHADLVQLAPGEQFRCSWGLQDQTVDAGQTMHASEPTHD
ncbi:aldose 1-epimerase family protein [Luteococcus sp. OSA5]|uniref:aldose 1-epimerase family protein n=1 Tax=Luteococcus sp. OSA5 TaxID=3401630 RepID=UPI003B430D16